MSNPHNFTRASIFQAAFPTISKDFSYGPEESHSHRQNPNTVPWSTGFLQTMINKQAICLNISQTFPCSRRELKQNQLQARNDLQRSTLDHLCQTKTLFPNIFLKPSQGATGGTFKALRNVTGKVQRTPLGSGSNYYSGKAGIIQGNVHRVLMRVSLSSAHDFTSFDTCPLTTTTPQLLLSSQTNFCIVPTVSPLDFLRFSSHLGCTFYLPCW